MIAIPIVANTYSFEIEVILEDELLKLRFVYNIRNSAWYLSFYKSDDTPVLTGVRLLPNYELIYKYKDLGLGAMYLVDIDNKPDYPTADNLGTRYELIYYTVKEVLDFKQEVLSSTIYAAVPV